MRPFLKRWQSAVGITLACASIAMPGHAQTLPGTVASSWVGNSFANQNGSQWVPDELRDMYVDPSGNVFTCGYNESGGSSAQYKNGAYTGNFSGFNSGFGDPTKCVVADGSSKVYWGDGNGVQVYSYGGGSSPNNSFLAGDTISGLAIHNGELYISDYTNNLIRVYNLSTLTQSRQWSVSMPGKITVDQNGNVWVIQYLTGSDFGGYLLSNQILSFSSTGSPGTPITGVVNPLALVINNSNQLLVGGYDSASQIRMYNLSGTTATFTGTLGMLGGFFGGTAGQAQPLKFNCIKGLGVDSSNNIYVAETIGPFWGQAVDVYNSSGQRQWMVFGNDYCDCAGIDPANETDVYDTSHHYKLDYSKSNGGEWSLADFTLNPFKYPNDPRILNGNGPGFRQGIGMVRIQGKPFVITSDQGGYSLDFFRFSPSTDGDVAIASTEFNGGNTTISRDANGNGQYDSGETTNGSSHWQQYFEIDANGDVFVTGDAGGPSEIIEYPIQGLDSIGNPIYTAASAITWSMPSGFGNIRRAHYDVATDMMYLAGRAAPDNNEGFDLVAAYSHWSGAKTQLWMVTIPYNDQTYVPDTSYGAAIANILKQAGQYVFIAYGYGYIRVLDKTTGAYIGTIKPSIGGFNGGGGQIDGAEAMTAYQRSNGEYVLLLEDSGHNHVVMVRWNLGSAAATPTFSPAGGVYSSAQSVTISDATSGSTIYYTTDGSTPTTSSTHYSGAISVGATETIHAIAAKSGLNTSSVASATYTLTTSSESAYNGPHNLPGTVQAEDYDIGGQGVAYSVNSNSGSNNSYRSDGVDLENCSDTGAGLDLGWTSAGQWTKYTCTVATAGTFNFSFRLAGGNGSTGTMHVIDTSNSNANITGSIATPNTGGWQTWQTITVNNINLAAGTHVLEIYQDTGNFNINWFSAANAGGSAPAAPTGLTATVGNAQVSLTWNSISGATSYNIYRGTTAGGESGTSIAAALTATSYVNTGLTNGTKYYFTVKAVNSSGTSGASNEVNATPVAASGSLTGSGTVLTGTTSTYNLTTEGTTDWTDWGAGSATDFNHKSSGGSKISNYTEVGSGGVGQNGDNDPRYSWTDGTPSGSSTGTTGGIFISNGTGNGFSFTASADTASRVLKVYAYGWNGLGKLNVHLSDSSAADYNNSTAWTQNGSGNFYVVYTLTYKAASAGNTIKVTWTLNTDNGGGAVGLQAATLH